MYLKSCKGLYGTTATGLSDGRLCTNISPLNVRLMRQGEPVGVIACSIYKCSSYMCVCICARVCVRVCIRIPYSGKF